MLQRPDRAVIPVAGLATRMHPLSRAVPKELLPLGRKPVLDHVVHELTGVGIRRFQMITSERTRAIERYFERDAELDRALGRDGEDSWVTEHEYLGGCSFHFVRQEVPRGIADAVLRARPFVDGKPFVLHMGDSVVTGDPDLLARMIAAHERWGACCTIAIHGMSEEEIRAGVGGATVIPRGHPDDEIFEIEGVLEKPHPGEIVAPAGLIGRYLISLPILDAPRSEEPRWSPLGGLGSIFPEREERDGPIIAVWCRPQARVHDAGTLDGYLRAQAFFALHDERMGSDILRMAREVTA